MKILTPESQIESIYQVEIPELVQIMPYDSWHRGSFTEEGQRWRFEFECNSLARRFFAAAIGRTPQEAFTVAKQMLMNQIREWHRTRFQAEIGRQPVEMPAMATTFSASVPRVLIVDDDIDSAQALEAALIKIGCNTEVANRHQDLHRKIIASVPDYILLDWNLNDAVTADKILEKIVRFVDAFSDLRGRFVKHRPRIVTYSVLDRSQITLPAEGHEYFDYLDHWQKPMPFPEVLERASGLMAVN